MSAIAAAESRTSNLLMEERSASPAVARLTAISAANDPKSAATTQPSRSVMWAPERFSTSSSGLSIEAISAPDLVRDLAEQIELRLLVVEGDQIARQRRGEPALRAERQALQRDVLGGLLDPLLELVGILQLGLLGGDQAEHDGLPLGYEAQGLERPGPGRVVLGEDPVALEVVEELLGDRVVAALDRPHRAMVATAKMDRPGDVRERANQLVVPLDHLAQPGLGVQAEVAKDLLGLLADQVRVAGRVELEVVAARLDALADDLLHQLDHLVHVGLAVRVDLVRVAGDPEDAGVGHPGERRLRRPVGVGADELVFLERQVVADAELLGHRWELGRRALGLIGGAVEHHRRGNLGVVAGEAVGERVEPEAAPDLAVGKHLDPGLLLKLDVVHPLLILEGLELSLVDRALLVPRHRVLELVVAQQASNYLAVKSVARHRMRSSPTSVGPSSGRRDCSGTRRGSGPARGGCPGRSPGFVG